MGTILSTVLITAPVAFIVGWLLAKAVFKHLLVVRPHSNTTATTSPAETATIDDSTKTLEASASDLQRLQEAMVERDHLIRDLKGRLAAKTGPLEDTPANATAQEGKLRQTVQALREGLAGKDKQLEQLKLALRTSEEKHAKTQRRTRSWGARLKHLAQQYRQQKMIMSELRDELRQRARQQDGPAVAESQPPAAQRPTRNSNVSDISELRALRGVGPAMQRKLNDNGIYKLRQLAEMNPADMLALRDELGVSPERMAKADWKGQARQILKLPASESAPTASEAAIAS